MDIQLHYTSRGSGPALILLHGNGESGEYFKNQLDAFSRSFTVIAVDTRGHGGSPRGLAPFTISQFADDLESFMDRLGLASAHILGFSDGGNIALEFAIRYPARVGRLIVDGANLFPSGVKPAVQLAVTLGYALARAIALVDKRARAKSELLALMAVQPHIAPAALGAIAAPTLVLAGTEDLIKEGHTRLIAASIPGARLRFIPGSHFIAAENSEAFNAAVLDFLS